MRTIHTPLVWQEWDRCLATHPDQRLRRYIVDGIRYGFRIGFEYTNGYNHTQGPRNNLPSAREHPEVVREYLANECSKGRVLGPLDPSQYPQVHTSRFGVIPKSTPGEWRLILDMSHPEGSSV